MLHWMKSLPGFSTMNITVSKPGFIDISPMNDFSFLFSIHFSRLNQYSQLLVSSKVESSGLDYTLPVFPF